MPRKIEQLDVSIFECQELSKSYLFSDHNSKIRSLISTSLMWCEKRDWSWKKILMNKISVFHDIYLRSNKIWPLPSFLLILIFTLIKNQVKGRASTSHSSYSILALIMNVTYCFMYHLELWSSRRKKIPSGYQYIKKLSKINIWKWIFIMMKSVVKWSDHLDDHGWDLFSEAISSFFLSVHPESLSILNVHHETMNFILMIQSSRLKVLIINDPTSEYSYTLWLLEMIIFIWSDKKFFLSQNTLYLSKVVRHGSKVFQISWHNIYCSHIYWCKRSYSPLSLSLLLEKNYYCINHTCMHMISRHCWIGIST